MAPHRQQDPDGNEEPGWGDLLQLVPDGVFGTLVLFAVSSCVGTAVLWLLWLLFLAPMAPEWVARKADWIHCFSLMASWWVLRLRTGSPFAGSEPAVVARMVELASAAAKAGPAERKKGRDDTAEEGAQAYLADYIHGLRRRPRRGRL